MKSIYFIWITLISPNGQMHDAIKFDDIHFEQILHCGLYVNSKHGQKKISDFALEIQKGSKEKAPSYIPSCRIEFEEELSA